jgi:hypothetical protein
MESLLSSSLMTESPRPVVGRPSHKPRCVLLAGSARGGTSWALKVLDSHPAVQGCHEPFYQLSHNEELGQLCDRVKAGNGTSADAEILMDLWMNASIQTNKPPFFEKSFLKTPAWLRKAAWMSARACKPMSSTFSYLASGEMNEHHCIVIKNRPFPLLDRILEVIHADALILLRHPCGVVSSWLRGMRMGVMQAASANPTEVWNRYSSYIEPLGFSENDLMKMSPAGLLAINWLVDTALFSHYENSPTMKTKVMVYCNMVRNPVQEWSKVFEWLHLPFDASVEAFLNQSSKPAFDMRQILGKKYSYFSVQRGEKSPLDSWRKDMQPDEIREVMSIVTPHFPVEKYWPDSPN